VRYVRKRGNTFLAIGANKHRAYAIATHRVRGVGTIKATIGTRGKTLSIKRNIGMLKCEAGYNFSTQTPIIRVHHRFRRKRT